MTSTTTQQLFYFQPDVFERLRKTIIKPNRLTRCQLRQLSFEELMVVEQNTRPCTWASSLAKTKIDLINDILRQQEHNNEEAATQSTS